MSDGYRDKKLNFDRYALSTLSKRYKYLFQELVFVNSEILNLKSMIESNNLDKYGILVARNKITSLKIKRMEIRASIRNDISEKSILSKNINIFAFIVIIMFIAMFLLFWVIKYNFSSVDNAFLDTVQSFVIPSFIALLAFYITLKD